MNKGIIGIILATILILGGGIFVFSRDSTPVPAPSSYEFYIGEGCPHCKIVEDFLKTWDNKAGVKLEQREVWYNKANAKVFAARTNACGIPTKEVGVPMLVTPEGKCISGDEPIIELLKAVGNPVLSPTPTKAK